MGTWTVVTWASGRSICGHLDGLSACLTGAVGQSARTVTAPPKPVKSLTLRMYSGSPLAEAIAAIIRSIREAADPGRRR